MNNLKKKILNNFYSIDDVCSVTIVGSYSLTDNIKKIGDIDVVVIFNNLSKNKILNCIKKSKNLKYSLEKITKRKLNVNSTFGPIKYDKDKLITLHLMIYDIKSHIEHVTNSPFTCFDWELSNLNRGKKLKDIYSVNCLQYIDFYNSKRSIKNYLTFLDKGVINYKKYIFSKINEKFHLRNFYFEIDNHNKFKYFQHIIFFLIINYLKLIKQKNYRPKFNEIKNIYGLIDKKLSITKKTVFTKFEVYTFLKKFDLFINNQYLSLKSIYISRHKKTNIKNNIFLGTKLNPSINDRYVPVEFRKHKFGIIFTSTLNRALESCLLISKKKQIITSKLLNEIDYGKVEGMNVKNLNKLYPQIINQWNLNKDPKFPNGENYKNIIKRLDLFFKLNKNRIHTKKKILIITHNVLIRTIIGKALNIPMYDWYKIKIDYFKLYNFKLQNGKLILNINRKVIKKILI